MPLKLFLKYYCNKESWEVLANDPTDSHPEKDPGQEVTVKLTATSEEGDKVSVHVPYKDSLKEQLKIPS